MEFLEKWLYGETSAQAHLNAAGLFTVAVFLISDFAPDTERFRKSLYHEAHQLMPRY